jgi:starch synthase
MDLNVLYISTEAVPFAKSGGLGDVIGSLPSEIRRQNADARIMLPLYQNIKEKYGSMLKYLGSIEVPLGWRRSYCGMYRLDADDMVWYFLDNEQYFCRDRLYGYYDDGERFAFYSKAALESLAHLDFKPDILHLSEWQTAMVPVFLKTVYHGSPEHERLKTVFTIHNIEYQGRFGKEIAGDLLGLSSHHIDLLELDGDINFMKGAIVACDRLTTVSPTYAEEIRYPFYSHGLSALIEEHRGKLTGILNGIAKDHYDPYRDKALVQRYSSRSIEKRERNKTALQEELGLELSSEFPLLAVVGRMVEHKGIALITHVFDEIIDLPVQFVLLGTGDPNYESFFQEQANRHKGRVATIIGFSSKLASRIYAGSDLFLMPSISEPCGLAQMIALRYGSVPIVRETGGLKDTIRPFDPVTGKGNGVTFASVNAHDMLDAIQRACDLYYDKPTLDRLRKNGFRTDVSWKKPAGRYLELYRSLINQ